MKSIVIYGGGDPGESFTYDPENPTEQQETLAWILRKNLYAMNGQSFHIVESEVNDFDIFEDLFDGFIGDVETWFSDAVAAKEAGDPIPALPSFPDLSTTFFAYVNNPFLTLIAKFAMQLLLAWIRKKLDPATSSDELVDAVNNIRFTPLKIILSTLGEYEDIVYE